MAALLIDGKAIAAVIKSEAKQMGENLLRSKGIRPGLAFILVGENPASVSYVRSKGKSCEELGFTSVTERLPATATEEEILALIARFNAEAQIHGILVQLPLPPHINEHRIIAAIDYRKDVDGLHPVNVGRLVLGLDCLKPCTPAGVQELLVRSGNDPSGKHVVVVGRSNIVGKPVAILLLARHATVTICHSRTKDLPGVVRSADVVIAAVGKAGMIRGSWIKPGAVVIDVGINRLPDGKLAGDVAFDEAREVAGRITPVPGGVGPMTIAMLLLNTLKAASKRI